MANMKITKTATGRYKISFYVPVKPTLETVTPTTITDDSRDYSLEALHRAKRQVIDYGENNEWTFFLTITFDKAKIDRDDRLLLYEKIKQTFKYYRDEYCPSFKYVALPEFHADGDHLHWHGIIYIPNYENMADITRHFDKEKRRWYWRSEYMFRKFGRVRFDKFAKDQIYASCYITKYITQENLKIFGVRYICSRGLATSTTVAEVADDELSLEYRERLKHLCNFATGEIVKPVTSTEYCTCYSLDETQMRIVFPELFED